MQSDEIHYRVIKLIEHQPDITQRELARALGISLGKANYCIKAVLEKGLVKAKNFKNSDNKRAYAYYLTPRGIEEKAALARRFLGRKRAEYESLKQEIDSLQQELAQLDPGTDS